MINREKIKELKIAVIGDVMIDRYIDGTVTRISPEDPTCLVLKSRKSVHTLGGAANVALNLAVMGAEVRLVGLGGSKDQNKLFMSILHKSEGSGKILVSLAETQRRMPVKTRFRAHGNQLLRVDYEEDQEPVWEESSALLQALIDTLSEGNFDMAVISDYRKGAFTDASLPILTTCLGEHKLQYVVDPKRASLEDYGRAMVICPNQAEWDAARAAGSRPQAHWVVVTRGEDGCTIEPWADGVGVGSAPYHVDTEPVEVCDPTGAGDTFISALAVSLSLNEDIEKACRFANAAACASVVHPGAYAPTFEEIEGRKPA